MTKVHLPNLHQTVVDTFLIINLNNSNNFNKFWVARLTLIKFTKQESVSQLVSESVSEWQALPMIGLGSDKNDIWFIIPASKPDKANIYRVSQNKSAINNNNNNNKNDDNNDYKN